MNNQQFRRLVLDRPAGAGDGAATNEGSACKDAATPSVLGSRQRASVPMTPFVSLIFLLAISAETLSDQLTIKGSRSVSSQSPNEFARQLRAQNEPPAKRFRTSVPKGTKLAAGYEDRTQLRTSQEDDAKAMRIKALEEAVKLGQMDQAAFEKVRDEITGGDVHNVHLVKGLDRRLLERVRRGEDVLSAPASGSTKDTTSATADEAAAPTEDVDEALDKLEAEQVMPVVREARQKTGSMAPPPAPASNLKRSRDDILRELKAARAQQQPEKPAPEMPALGPKFRKMKPDAPSGPRIEIDAKGREVLITVDADGRVKRKVRKARPKSDDTLTASAANSDLLVPDANAAPLDADVTIPRAPTPPPVPEESDDIFADAGDDYDPLGAAADSDSASSSDGEIKSDRSVKEPPKPETSSTNGIASIESSPTSKPSRPSRNYFNEEPESTEITPVNPLQDPSLMAALRKASSLAQQSRSAAGDGDSRANDEEARKAARHRAMLSTHDRDADDLDMGFGSSRFEDQEDGEEARVKLSKWRDQRGGDDGGDDDDDDDEGDYGGGGGSGSKSRKRGKKKKKADGNDARQVLAVMERRAKS